MRCGFSRPLGRQGSIRSSDFKTELLRNCPNYHQTLKQTVQDVDSTNSPNKYTRTETSVLAPALLKNNMRRTLKYVLGREALCCTFTLQHDQVGRLGFLARSSLLNIPIAKEMRVAANVCGVRKVLPKMRWVHPDSSICEKQSTLLQTGVDALYLVVRISSILSVVLTRSPANEERTEYPDSLQLP